jgi:hypothetical protein
MGNNSSSLQSKTSSTNGKNNELINKLFEPNVVDTLNMNDNTNTGGSTIPVIRVSHLPQLGGFLPVANKYNHEFIANMNKNRIFNLIHETEIEQYHLNNMKKEGIFNNQETVIRGGSVLNANNTNTNTNNNTNNIANESDVSDAMNRIKEVIANELKEQELKGGAKNRNGCGCGGNGDDSNKHSNKCEFGKGKGKKAESSLKNRKKESSPSSSSSDNKESGMNDDSSTKSSNSNSSSTEEGGMRRNTGLSVFPFNSSDMSSRHPRRKI